MDRSLSRRAMLRGGALALAGAALPPACAAPRATGSARDRTRRRLVRVRVSEDRVIRAVAGLRPFRPSGFVVRAERLDDKAVVHNYGHGGGGISLSWGSASLAADLAVATGARSFAVLGCGVMGLSTARILQDRGCEATIYARELPPDTTSNIAGGQWSPFSVSEEGRTTPEYDALFERAARLSHRHFQGLVGADYGVRWIDNYVLRDRPFPPGPARGPLDDLYPAGRVLEPGEHAFAAAHVRTFTTMLVEPHVYLDRLVRDFLLRGGHIVVRAFRDVREVAALDEPAVVNCTGLGARELFGDRELVPVRGQLVVLLPQPEVDYITLAGEFYMFPRSDGILLGGTRERGVWSTETDPGTVARILDGNRAVFQAMRG